MNATLVYDEPHTVRLVGADLPKSFDVPKFSYVFEARAWALEKNLAFVDNRYKRVEVREGGYTWQIVIKRLPRAICERMGWTGYAGVTLEKGSSLAERVRGLGDELAVARRRIERREPTAEEMRLLWMEELLETKEGRATARSLGYKLRDLRRRPFTR